MAEVNAAWLKQLGVEVPDESELDELATQAMEELELRVGSTIASSLTEEQLAEFELIEDEDKRVDWVEKTCPNYTSIVTTEHDSMGTEIKNAKDKTGLIRSWA